MPKYSITSQIHRNRVERLARIQMIVRAMADGPMTTRAIVALLKCRPCTIDLYKRVMLMARVIEEQGYDTAGRKTRRYGLVAGADLPTFYENLMSTGFVEPDDEARDTCQQKIERTRAVQIGIERPWYITCLFGAAPEGKAA